MPSTDTIASTDLLTASANLTLTSAAWNNHFGVWRGHLLPVDASTSAAANNAYDLGSTTYKWRAAYIGQLNVDSFKTSIASTTGAFSFGSQEMVLLNANGGAFTVTLPAAAVSTGTSLALKKTDSSYNAITLDGNGSETIEGTTTAYINTPNECLYLQCDGSAWYIKNRYISPHWTSWTPTASWSTNVTFSGQHRRIGAGAEFEVTMNVAGAVTTTALQFTLPSTHPIDTNALNSTSTSFVVGDAGILDSGSGTYHARVFFVSTFTVEVMVFNAAVSWSSANVLSNTIPMTWANNDRLYARFVVPIKNWSI